MFVCHSGKNSSILSIGDITYSVQKIIGLSQEFNEKQNDLFFDQMATEMQDVYSLIIIICVHVRSLILT